MVHSEIEETERSIEKSQNMLENIKKNLLSNWYVKC